MSVGPERRLAVYGSLAPGEPNHAQLAGLAGTWTRGTVHGRLDDRGWGAHLGFPALRLDPAGPPVPVQLFTSDDLPRHWSRLDAFEGDDYVRLVAEVELEDGTRVEASLYAAAG